MHIQFTTQIQKKDFVRLFFSITLRKPAIIVSLFLGFGVLVFVALSHFNYLGSEPLKNPLFMFLIGLSSILYLIFGIYRNAVKNYSSHERLNQELTYLLTDDKVSFTGAAFANELEWKSFYKIESIGRNWIVLYNSKTIANFLPIGGLGAEEKNQLREFLNANKSSWTTKIKV